MPSDQRRVELDSDGVDKLHTDYAFKTMIKTIIETEGQVSEMKALC